MPNAFKENVQHKWHKQMAVKIWTNITIKHKLFVQLPVFNPLQRSGTSINICDRAV
jgi:hypothetical protein